MGEWWKELTTSASRWVEENSWAQLPGILVGIWVLAAAFLKSVRRRTKAVAMWLINHAMRPAMSWAWARALGCWNLRTDVVRLRTEAGHLQKELDGTRLDLDAHKKLQLEQVGTLAAHSEKQMVDLGESVNGLQEWVSGQAETGVVLTAYKNLEDRVKALEKELKKPRQVTAMVEYHGVMVGKRDHQGPGDPDNDLFCRYCYQQSVRTPLTRVEQSGAAASNEAEYSRSRLSLSRTRINAWPVRVEWKETSAMELCPCSRVGTDPVVHASPAPPPRRGRRVPKRRSRAAGPGAEVRARGATASSPASAEPV